MEGGTQGRGHGSTCQEKGWYKHRPHAGSRCCRQLPSHHMRVRPPLQVLDNFDFVFVVLFSLRLKIIKIIAYWLELFQNIDHDVCIPKNSLRFL